MRDIDFFSSFQMGELTLSMGGGGGVVIIGSGLKYSTTNFFVLQNKLRKGNFCPKLIGFPSESCNSLRYAILQEVLIFYKR